MSASVPNLFHRIPEVADRLQVSDRSVRRWIRQGALIAHRFGHQWRVSDPDLELFMRERRGFNLQAKHVQ